MSPESQHFTDFKDNLKEADKKLDNNLDANGDGNIDDNEINDSESQLEYNKAISKIENQYDNIKHALSIPGISETNKTHLLTIQKSLDTHVLNINNDIDNAVSSESKEKFTEIAKELNNHWDGIFVEQISKENLDQYLKQLHVVQKGEVLSKIVHENYLVGGKDIRKVITFLYLQNPDLIKTGEIIIIPQEILKNGVKLFELYDIFKIKKEQLHTPIKKESVLIEDTGIDNLVDIDKGGNIIIKTDLIEAVEYNKNIKKIAEKIYKQIIESEPKPSKKILKEMFGNAKTIEDRLKIIEKGLIEEASQQVALNRMLKFIYGDEQTQYKQNENTLSEVEEWKKNKTFKTTLEKLSNILKGNPALEDYNKSKLKYNASKRVINIIRIGMTTDFNGMKPIEYLDENISETKFKEIYQELKKENQINTILNVLTNKTKSFEEKRLFEYNMIISLSDNLRAGSVSIFTKKNIEKLSTNELESLLPKNFDLNLESKYNIEKKQVKNKEKKGYPELNTIESYRIYKIQKYFQSIEPNRTKDISRVSNYFENNILSKKQGILEGKINSIYEKEKNKNEKINELENQLTKYLKEKINNFGIKNNLLSIEIESLVKTMIVGNISNINKLIERDIYNKKNNLTLPDWNKTIGFEEKLLGNIGNTLNKIKEKLVRVNDIAELTGEKSEEKMTEEEKINKKIIILKGLLQNITNGNRLSSISDYKQDIEGKDFDTSVRLEIDILLFGSKEKRTKIDNKEAQIFNIYQNVTDKLNDKFTLSDNSVESLINGAVLTVSAILGANFAVIIGKIFTRFLTTGKITQPMLQSEATGLGLKQAGVEFLAESGFFTAMNLSYTNFNTGKISKDDVLKTVLFSMAIGFASIKGKNIFNSKISENILSYGGQASSVSVVYKGDFKAIARYLMKRKIGKAKISDADRSLLQSKSN